MTAALPLIPVVDARLGGPLATARAAAVQMTDLLATARLIYSLLLVGDGPGVLCRRHAIRPVDWLNERVRVWRSRALPPAHLLRLVCDRCDTYEDARRVLSETLLCLPAFSRWPMSARMTVAVTR